ncbi:PREDICTED: CD151 antigen-like [Ceratosolen solmsi marchali]|uniref:Tetraspanin n=1 Tax=Ceratosolen solmsi marchali TaxID=326594 RepID=A0AAJ6YJ57_9HYME|nr:PREDICTED: CD151 antigen-like [Ceratosolen solmsi marchali]
MGYDTEMDSCGRCMKYTLFVINFIIFIGGICITGLAIWALVDKVNYVSELTGNNLLTGTVYVLLVGGIIVSIIAFFGCIGASREIKCMLLMYFIIVLLLFVIILIGGVLGYVFREKFIETLQQQMQNSMHLYREKKEITEAWDFVQSKLHCCGVRSWQDWSRYFNEVPISCCREMTDGRPIACNRYPDSINQYNAYPWGCVEATQNFMQKHAAVLGGAGFAVAFLMLLGMIFSCALFKMIH